MKKLRKILGLVLVMAITVSVLPFNVFADPTTQISIVFDSNGSRANLSRRVDDSGEHIVAVVDGQDNFVGIELASATALGAGDVVVSCESDTKCTATITMPAGDGVNVVFGGDSPVGIDEHQNTENITSSTSLTVVDREVMAPFDGKAVLVWSCGDRICYHQYNNLPTDNNPFYYDAADITADNDAGEKFNVHAEKKFFASLDKFNEKKAAIDANSVTIDSLIGPDGIDYEPLGEPTLNNAYVSYGGRNFKAIIYNEEFRALSLGSLEGLNYYPGKWTNGMIRQDAFDISGTSKEHPIVIDTMLLESTINLNKLGYNDFTIAKVEALDVPKKAVTVSTNNDGVITINFASRFYDQVVFKLTDTEGNEYYFEINRQTADLIDAHITPEGKFYINGDLYFSRNTSYTDYIFKAKVVYKDGTTKNMEFKNTKKIDDGLGNIIRAYEIDEENPGRQDYPIGKGMKRANYEIEIDNAKNIDKIYINIEFTGSTGTTYNGAFAGSGKGMVLDMSDFERRG